MMKKIFDTHVHLDHLKDLGASLAASRSVGVMGVVCMSMDLASCKKNLEIKAQYGDPPIYLAMGQHPSEAGKEDIEPLIAFIRGNKKNLHAIGEIGLDFWYKWVRKDDVKKKEQRDAFRRLLEAAKELNLPAVIHARGTWRECLETAKDVGVNLPARRAIIRDCKRFESGVGQSYIPTSEYKQCAGRAGRPQYDEYGEAVLMAKSSSEMDTMFERYIQADPEPVISKLDNERSLRMHVLSSIAGGYVHDVESMFDFIGHTFLYHQRVSDNILSLIAEIFEFLNKEKFIEKSGTRFFATPLGNLTSRLYIDPVTSITIRNGLNAVARGAPLTPIGVMHLLCLCPDNPVMNVGKNDGEDLEKFVNHYQDDFIFTPANYPDLEDLYRYMATVKTTWLYSQWIEEEREDLVCEQFDIGPGDIYRYVESAQWLLYGASLIADMLMNKRAVFFLDDLRKRVRYGIKAELLELSSLKGVGRVRARALFAAGIKTYQDIKFKSVDELAYIPHIGKTLAKDLIAQIDAPPKKRKTAAV